MIDFSDYTPDVREALEAEEAERVSRDRKQVKRCPICGKVPEDGIEKAGRHIYTFHCEKCQAGFVIHVNA